MIDLLLTKRIIKLHNPWNYLYLETHKFKTKLNECQNDVSEYNDLLRDENYHLGRIKYFMLQLNNGENLDPIEIDNWWSGNIPIGIVVCDGNHRLMAHAMNKTKWISVRYSGCVKILEWLKGKSEICPL